MDKRVVGTLLGIAVVLLWFMPWMEFSVGDMEFYRTGSHIGGIAYLLLMSSLAYAVLSWVAQRSDKRPQLARRGDSRRWSEFCLESSQVAGR